MAGEPGYFILVAVSMSVKGTLPVFLQKYKSNAFSHREMRKFQRAKEENKKLSHLQLSNTNKTWPIFTGDDSVGCLVLGEKNLLLCIFKTGGRARMSGGWTVFIIAVVIIIINIVSEA